MPRPAPPTIDDLHAQLGTLVPAMEGAWTARQLLIRLPKPFQKLGEAAGEWLRAEVSAGRLCDYPPLRQQARYGRAPLESFVAKTLDQLLASRPLTLSELKAKAKSPLSGVSETRWKGVLDRELQAGRIHKHPPRLGSRTALYSSRPLDPQTYVGPALDKICQTLAKAGVDAAAVYRAAGLVVAERLDEPSPKVATVPPAGTPPASPALEDLGERILAAAPRVTPQASRGALVSLAQLRHLPELCDVSKSDFDTAILGLVERGRIHLHRHDFPAGLTPEQRADLVRDAYGQCFVGLVVRGPGA